MSSSSVCPQISRLLCRLALRRELQACVAGNTQWPIYQKLVGRILEHLFCPPLNVPLSESPDESGVNRRDFILANFAEQGYWSHIRSRYAADYVVIDAKDYAGKVKKRAVLQMANYLRHYGAGLFGPFFQGSAATIRRESQPANSGRTIRNWC